MASNVTLIMPGTSDSTPAPLNPDQYPLQPALFKFKNGNSTVYLYGTVHRVVEGIKWRTNEFNRAIAKSDRIWFESTFREMANPTLMVDQYISMRNINGLRIEDILDKKEMAKLRKVAQSQNVDIDEYGELHPWVISDILKGAHYKTDIKKDKKQEIVSGVGVEETIDAMGLGKPILPLENTRKHVMLFSQLSPEDEKALLMDTVNQIDHSVKDRITGIMDAWSKGDLPALEKLDVSMRNNTPGLYGIIMTERNQIMADKIATILKGSGTDFVAVGAAHLPGPGGVVALLEKAGYKSERIYDIEPPVTSNTEREMFPPHYRPELRVPTRLVVSLVRGRNPDEVILHFQRSLTFTGCIEVSPIKTDIRKNEDSIDIDLVGYIVNIHPYPNIDGCGPAVKTAMADIPLSVSELKKYKVHLVKMQSMRGYDFYTLTYENGTLTLAPKKGTTLVFPDLKKLALTGL